MLVNSRRLLSMLLVCSVLVPLTIPQLANGQTLTETSTQYSTSNLVTIVHSTIETTATSMLPVRYELTPFGYSYQTGSFSLSQMDTGLVSRSSGWEDYPCLYYDYFLLNATAGHEIRVHFELSEKWQSIDFFILSSSEFRHFGNCGHGNWSWELHTFASSYDFNWPVPESGVYAFLFLSREFYGGSINITAQDYSTTTQSSTEILTTTKTYTLQSYQIALSTLTSMSSQPSTTEYYYAAIILIVILAFTVGFILLRTKRPR